MCSGAEKSNGGCMGLKKQTVRVIKIMACSQAVVQKSIVRCQKTKSTRYQSDGVLPGSGAEKYSEVCMGLKKQKVRNIKIIATWG